LGALYETSIFKIAKGLVTYRNSGRSVFLYFFEANDVIFGPLQWPLTCCPCIHPCFLPHLTQHSSQSNLPKGHSSLITTCFPILKQQQQKPKVVIMTNKGPHELCGLLTTSLILLPLAHCTSAVVDSCFPFTISGTLPPCGLWTCYSCKRDF
jgi:hypothetical protein